MAESGIPIVVESARFARGVCLQCGDACEQPVHKTGIWWCHATLLNPKDGKRAPLIHHMPKSRYRGDRFGGRFETEPDHEARFLSDGPASMGFRLEGTDALVAAFREWIRADAAGLHPGMVAVQDWRPEKP